MRVMCATGFLTYFAKAIEIFFKTACLSISKVEIGHERPRNVTLNTSKIQSANI